MEIVIWVQKVKIACIVASLSALSHRDDLVIGLKEAISVGGSAAHDLPHDRHPIVHRKNRPDSLEAEFHRDPEVACGRRECGPSPWPGADGATHQCAQRSRL